MEAEYKKQYLEDLKNTGGSLLFRDLEMNSGNSDLFIKELYASLDMGNAIFGELKSKQIFLFLTEKGMRSLDDFYLLKYICLVHNNSLNNTFNNKNLENKYEDSKDEIQNLIFKISDLKYIFIENRNLEKIFRYISDYYKMKYTIKIN